MILYGLTAKIDRGIPIVTMKSNAGFTAQSQGRDLISAFRKVIEDLEEKERKQK